jgi:hypothetical protein
MMEQEKGGSLEPMDLYPWEKYPQQVAGFEFRHSHMKGTSFESTILARKLPGQSWEEWKGKRLSAEDARRSLLAKGYVFAHRSRYRSGGITLTRELWLPVHLAHPQS